MKNKARFAVVVLVFAALIGCRSQSAVDVPSERILDVFAGASDVFILWEDRTLWGAGFNHAGQLGLGQIPQRGIMRDDASGVPVSGRIYDDTGAPFSGVRYAAIGESHSVILREDGTLWGAGASASGELGLEGESLLVFTRLKADGVPLSGVSAAAAGSNSTFFICTDNSLWAAGFNHYGELGLGNQDTQFSFTRVESAGRNIRAIVSGMRHTVLLKENGTLWVSGYNFKGQLGLGDTADRASFTEVRDAGSGITAVAAGNYHTVILRNDGSVWAAGSNFWGQLGLPDSGSHHTFTRLTDTNGRPLTGIQTIAARGDMTLLLTSDGSLLLTGNYTDPQSMMDIAASDTEPALRTAFAPLLPEQGANFGSVQRVTLGSRSIHVIDSNGRLWAAGSNRHGQLKQDADITISSVLRPVNP